MRYFQSCAPMILVREDGIAINRLETSLHCAQQ